MYKDGKVRLCPMCGKNIVQCQCEKNKQQDNTVKFVQCTQSQYDNLIQNNSQNNQ